MPTTKRQVSHWPRDIAPLLQRYAGRKHPLEYRNRYELLVMVMLSARTSDKNVNALAPALFKQYPTLAALAAAQPEDLFPFVRKVTGFVRKATWLVSIARTLGSDSAIPDTVEALTKLPGIGRKSANVIISESGAAMSGVIVDLHVLRVAPRIGIAKGSTPEMVERDLMRVIPRADWRALGMSLTFLGRELCRPTDPFCHLCPMEESCRYAQKRHARGKKPQQRLPASRRPQ